MAVAPEKVITSDPTAAQDDPKFRSLRTRSSPIQFSKVNPKAIHKLLGVPFGGRKLKDGNPLRSRDPKVVEWRNRYPRKNVPPTKIVKNITNAPDEDSFFFRMDFVMCFLSVLVECRAQAPSNTVVIFVKLLYVDSFTCEGIEPDPSKNAISFWTMDKLKCRENWETKHGGFGKGKFKTLSKAVDDGSEKLSGFDISYLVAEVENDIMNLANVKSNLDHSFYQLKNNSPQSPQLKLLQDKYMEIISSGPIYSPPPLNSHVIGADSNPQHDPVADEQANHSAHELEQSHSSNRSKDSVSDEEGSEPSDVEDSNSKNDHEDTGVDENVGDSPDQHTRSFKGPDDQHHEAYSGAPTDSSSDDEAETYAKFCAGDSLYDHSNKYDKVSLDDEAQPIQASAHHPEPLNQTHADHHYAPAKVKKAPSIVEEESDPSGVIANASVVETSKFEEEAPAQDAKTDNQASVDNLNAHEKNDKVSDEPHHIITSVLDELLESLKAQPSPENIPSPQKAPDNMPESPIAAVPITAVPMIEKVTEVAAIMDSKRINAARHTSVSDYNMPESPIAAVPITAVPMIEKVTEVAAIMDSKRINAARHTSVSDVSMSTCLHSAVQLGAPFSMEETKILNLLFNPQKNTMKGKHSTNRQPCFLKPGDHVFYSPTHVQLNKEVMQSLHYDQVVDVEVIRAWVDVLNFKELKRSSSSPHRVFCPPNLIHLKGVDLLLIPVEESDCFYLMVFDLTNPSILVIDSFHSKKPLVRLVDSSDYYKKDSAYKMKSIVCGYLQSHSHPMTHRFTRLKISRVPIDWATSSYSTQNRVFLMRHMEKYFGQNKVFQCDFSKHGSQKNCQLNKLRNKYAAAIMLSEVNLLLPKIKSLLMS
ncbi:hypothetical protein SSX86_001918 [Deinandra increscens subsp. villosa]|uniref:Ubiquitin-like protease family profile domain-containing protein n=1 Tax=Deinandra increscens subsp. villosa TaxID=3103831 RepID=A0AAP0DWC4_9ASTR